MLLFYKFDALNSKGKAVLVKGRRDPWDCETCRFPYFLPTDGGEIVSLTRRLPCTPRKISGTHFC
jgi:hypothetical protein